MYPSAESRDRVCRQPIGQHLPRDSGIRLADLPSRWAEAVIVPRADAATCPRRGHAVAATRRRPRTGVASHNGRRGVAAVSTSAPPHCPTRLRRQSPARPSSRRPRRDGHAPAPPPLSSSLHDATGRCCRCRGQQLARGRGAARDGGRGGVSHGGGLGSTGMGTCACTGTRTIWAIAVPLPIPSRQQPSCTAITQRAKRQATKVH